MLPFSSITSIVPFFLLALAYFLYFSTAILTKHIPHGNKEDQREIIIKADLKNTAQLTYPDYRNIDDKQSQGIITTPGFFPEKDILFIFLCPESVPGISDPHRLSAFSPRPPPVC